MERHKAREKNMICIYQYLVTNHDINEIVTNNFGDEKEEYADFSETIINNVVEKKDVYIGYINDVLDDWSFNRLGYIEQSILLCACGEFDAKITEAPVIIDESIILAKDYCDEDAYKLVNGVLDRL